MTEKSIALIGAGYWGKNLVRNFHQLGVLKTICDQSGAIRQQMAKDYPDTTVTDDYNALLSDPNVQAVVISAPAVAHYDLAHKALEAGKHVFVEKPLSLTYEDGARLVALARQARKILFIGHILHYHAAVVKLKELVKAGKIGRLQYIYSRRLSLGKIRREENILWSFAPHDISLILSITGEDPSYIDSVGSNFLHALIADVTMTNLKFPSGIGAHIFVNWLNPFKEQRLVVIGSQGMLVFDDTQAIDEKLVLYPHTINWKNGIPTPEKAEAEAIGLSDHWEEPLKAECRAFLEAITTGQPPITNGEEGLRVLKVLENCHKSMEVKERRVTPASLPLTPHYYAHETAMIDEGVEIGAGTKIWHFSHVLSGSRIGEKCNIGQNVVIGPDVIIGNGCKVQNNVSLYKGVVLEDDVFCGPSCVFTNVYNPRAFIERKHEFRNTLVRKGATIGANATIVCGVTIDEYAIIGAGAVVKKDVPAHAVMVGVPAKQKGWACRCGTTLKFKEDKAICSSCERQYALLDAGIKEIKS
jgi:UDP-2-acetamido-3-amino-2,3-dideoxy-glucuronate N-acetyltransferase